MPIIRWLRTTYAQASHHPFEATTFAMVAIGVLAAIAFTIRAGMDASPRRDLAFEGAVREVNALLTNQGADSLVRTDAVSIMRGDSVVRTDTLMIVADSLKFPGFAKGGFLADQIQMYNDFTLVASQRAERQSAGATPSIFRVERTDSGALALGSNVNAFSLLVRSPFAEDRWRPVYGMDFGRGPALIGLRGEVGLEHRPVNSTMTQQLNGRACEFRTGARDSLMFYCTSSANAGVHRFFDLVYIPGLAANELGGRVSRYRARKIWVNGLGSLSPGPITSGDLIDSDTVGSLMLSSRDHGVLAENQWVNGRTSFLSSNPGTLSLFGRAGRSIPSPGGSATPLRLALDVGFSGDLEREVRQYAAAHADVLDRMAVVVLDLHTGGIRAIAESDPRGANAGLLSFEPLLMGSMIKPILAAAILAREPELARLVVPYAGPVVSSVDGIALSRPFKNELHGCAPGAITLELFLQCSSNQYAAELMVRAIMTAPGAASARSTGAVPVDALDHSPVAEGLATEFDVDVAARRSGGRLDRYWSADATESSAAEQVQDRTLVPWESRPWMVFPGTTSTPVNWLARYAFGGWENRWTLIGVAEAYARIATDRRVMATFLNNVLPSFANMDTSAREGFRAVRGGLARVATIGTANGLAESVAKALPADKALRVLAKTGTMNELAADVFLKSLAMVIGRPSGDGAAAMKCGLVAISYFEFRSDWRSLARASADNLPNLHTDFAKAGELSSLARNWSRLSPC